MITSTDNLFLQRTYADIVSLRLDRFTKQSYSPYRANFRCPICGDSQKNKFKKRAYFLEKDNHLVFYCHNECGVIGFTSFLKTYYDDLYSQYRFDLLKEQGNERREQELPSSVEEVRENTETDPGLYNSIFDNRARVVSLDDSVHYVQDYIKSRKIPSVFYKDIFFTNNFHLFINEIIPEKFDKSLENKHEERVILPLRTIKGNVFGVIARSINGEGPKYLSIKFIEDHPKFFGLERLDKSQYAYVLEGPLDSFFIKNSIAMAGTDSDPLQIFDNSNQFTLILDNQPRNKSVIKKYEKYIRRGFNVLIWPTKIIHKDINDCVLGGIKYNELMKMINENTFSGLKAEIMLKQWRRI